jgi:hypothetical protein
MYRFNTIYCPEVAIHPLNKSDLVRQVRQQLFIMNGQRIVITFHGVFLYSDITIKSDHAAGSAALSIITWIKIKKLVVRQDTMQYFQPLLGFQAQKFVLRLVFSSSCARFLA